MSESLRLMPNEEGVKEILRAVLDPELGISITDLGLIYRVDASRDALEVDMSLTSPTCPLGGHLRQQAEDLLRNHFPLLSHLAVNLVWQPPWQPQRMSASAKQQLGWPEQ